MSLSENEIESCVSKFEKLVYVKTENQKTEEDFFTLFDLLRKDSELSKNNENVSQSSLQNLLSSDNKNIVEKYIDLKENNKKLQEEQDDLVKRLDTTVIEHITYRETSKMEHSSKLTEMEQNYQSQIDALRFQNAAEKKNFNEQMSTLLNQMSAVQASSDLQCDEVETKLKKQLIDVNNKLRESQNNCRSLNLEIQHLKSQAKNQNTPKSSPRNALSFNELQPPNRSNNHEESKDRRTEVNKENELLSKYPQLQITKTNTGQESNINLNIRIPPPPLYRSYDSKTGSKPTRKRKLYDPNDVEFDLDE